MKHFYFTILAVFIIHITYSQNELKYCGADELRINTLKKQPLVAKAVIKNDEALEKFTKSFVPNKGKTSSSNQVTYIIPVVFHVIHNYGIENISDAQLIDGLDIVNKTFRKTHPNNSSIIPAFQGIHADCDIEFRLATKDPNGNCHSGINRIASPLTTSGDHRVKSLIHWPQTKYLNVYIVANAANLAGHAIWPSDADTMPSWDGIVLSHNYVGTFGTSTLMQSVVFAHECGHYLNLQHIWGGNNVPNFYFYPCADPSKDCNIDDLVTDTPPTIGWQSCNLTGASCGNVVDNVQNTMDYSYCNIMFTEGQKTRMQACLNYTIAGRNNLWQPSNLIATGVTTPATLCKADFLSDKKIICPNTPVKFSNTSYNGIFTSLSWKFSGGTPSISSITNPTVTYSTAGNYDVELKIKNGNDSLIVTKQNYISVLTSSANISFPFSESFESTNPINGLDWVANNLDTSNTWQVTNTSSYIGNKSVMLNNFSSTLNGKDELYSKPINLTGASSLNVSFKYAFARRDTSNRDKLQLFIVQSCNGTTVPRFTSSGSLLETVPLKTNAFYPSTINEWKQVAVTIPSFFYTSTFRLKFVFEGNKGNNLFIDDINLDINAGLNSINEELAEFTVFPNPTTDNSYLKFTIIRPKTLYVVITNILGEELLVTQKNNYAEGENKLQLNTHILPSGLYFVKLTDGVSEIVKPLVVNK